MKPTTITPTASPNSVRDNRQNVDKLLALKKITPTDVATLTETERKHLNASLTKTLNSVKGEERDAFLEKIELIVPASTKSDIWDYNHEQINNVIAAHMCKHGLMPNQRTIADQTGLSRQTIGKHLQQYKVRPEFAAELEQFKFMASSVLAKVFKSASTGDLKAARLYFEMIGAKEKANTTVNDQRNYIQINNTILSQENLTRLSAEQLNQIESILAGVGVVNQIV